jgi:multiple sugar transport system substrate-binding protein/putative chitobiose transport system substrate-binding protein
VLVYEGVTLLNEDRTAAAFNTDEAVEVLERYKTAYDAGGIAPGAVKFNANAYTENLENGKLAFIPSTGAWMVESLQKNAPDVYADLGVATAPRTDDGTLLLLGQQTFVIPKQSKHQRAAAEFIAYVTNAENQLAFAKIVPIYPSAVDAVSDPFFTSVEGTGIEADIRAAIADALPDMEYYELGSRDDTALSDALNRQVERYMLGQVTAQEALDTAEKEWNDLLADN